MTVHTCGRCGALCERDARTCPRCGRYLPALLGARAVLDRIFPRPSHWAQNLALLIIAIFLVVTLVAQRRGDVGNSLLDRFTAGFPTMAQFGALMPTMSRPVGQALPNGNFAIVPPGQWWRLLTANFLHFGLIHILFNAMSMFQAGAMIERLYGPARMLIVFLVSGVIGFLASALIAPSYTAGASAGLCGFIGALFAYGKRRGGTHGEQLRNVAIQWTVWMIGYGLIFSGINNVAHLGGALGGLAVAWGFDVQQFDRRGRESDGARLLALLVLLGALVCVGFALANAIDMQRAMTGSLSNR